MIQVHVPLQTMSMTGNNGTKHVIVKQNDSDNTKCILLIAILFYFKIQYMNTIIDFEYGQQQMYNYIVISQLLLFTNATKLLAMDILL